MPLFRMYVYLLALDERSNNAALAFWSPAIVSIYVSVKIANYLTIVPALAARLYSRRNSYDPNCSYYLVKHGTRRHSATATIPAGGTFFFLGQPSSPPHNLGDAPFLRCFPPRLGWDRHHRSSHLLGESLAAPELKLLRQPCLWEVVLWKRSGTDAAVSLLSSFLPYFAPM